MLISVINFPNWYKKNVLAFVKSVRKKWPKLRITSTHSERLEKRTYFITAYKFFDQLVLVFAFFKKYVWKTFVGFSKKCIDFLEELFGF